MTSDKGRIIIISSNPANIPANEAEALKELRENQLITVLPADKQIAMIDYIAKMKQIIEDDA